MSDTLILYKDQTVADGDKALYIIEGTGEHKNLVVRHRLSKEIALEMLEQYGAFSHMRVLEKHENPAFWRDVLTWLDELTQGEKK